MDMKSYMLFCTIERIDFHEKKFRSRRSIKSKNETPNNNSFKMKFAIDIDVFDTG